MAKKKTQILLIGGGMTFQKKSDYISYLKNKEISLEKRKKWHATWLDKSLGNKFEIIRANMPNKVNAKYDEWKIVFENYLKVINKDIILIGNSLGGIFLAKYLSENKIKNNIISLYLICTPFDEEGSIEELSGGFRMKKDLNLLDNCTNNLYFLYSADDPIVPIIQADKFKKRLTNAIFKIYKSKNGHFIISTFPEIVKMIKKDV